jgi:hypothetical protein
MEQPQPQPQPRSKNNNSTIGCLVVRDEPNSSSSVINDVFLNKEDAIGDQTSSVNMSQPLILPQKPLENKIIPASKSFNFLNLPKNHKKKFMFV